MRSDCSRPLGSCLSGLSSAANERLRKSLLSGTERRLFFSRRGRNSVETCVMFGAFSSSLADRISCSSLTTLLRAYFHCARVSFVPVCRQTDSKTTNKGDSRCRERVCLFVCLSVCLPVGQVSGSRRAQELLNTRGEGKNSPKDRERERERRRKKGRVSMTHLLAATPTHENGESAKANRRLQHASASQHSGRRTKIVSANAYLAAPADENNISVVTLLPADWLEITTGWLAGWLAVWRRRGGYRRANIRTSARPRLALCAVSTWPLIHCRCCWCFRCL